MEETHMDFMSIVNERQSVRAYEEGRMVEQEKIDSILEAARLSPSACNGQPYHVTVCKGEAAKKVAELCIGRGGMNKFAAQAPVLLVVSEEPYCASAALGAISENDSMFGKALIFVGLAEGVALYGLIIALVLLFVS